jgi:uncharacterized phage-associated protein
MIRFRTNWSKCIEAIDLLSRAQDGITQYYVGKVCYFADKEHLLDYGRPITGDRYVAMEHGPVPSNIRDLLKQDGGLADDVLTELYTRISIEKRNNLQHVSSKKVDGFPHLSKTDQEYLLSALEKYGNMSFPDLKRVSHDTAWKAAWAEDGLNNEMDPEHWLDALGEQRNSAVAYLSDRRVRRV